MCITKLLNLHVRGKFSLRKLCTVGAVCSSRANQCLAFAVTEAHLTSVSQYELRESLGYPVLVSGCAFPSASVQTSGHRPLLYENSTSLSSLNYNFIINKGLFRKLSELYLFPCRRSMHRSSNIRDCSLHTRSSACVAASETFLKNNKIDKSRVPELSEDDLEEKFILGWGPGGQSVNKTASAVYLRHVPTGLSVKCHQHRGQHQNRREARLMLQQRLDELINGSDSVASQQERLRASKAAKRNSKAKKRNEMKALWMEERSRERGDLDGRCRKEGDQKGEEEMEDT